MKSKSGEHVNFLNQTSNKFFLYYQNSFLILPDSKTIVGVEGKRKQTLIIEDITTNKALSFGKHEDHITTVLYDEVIGSLFAGDYKGDIKQ